MNQSLPVESQGQARRVRSWKRMLSWVSVSIGAVVLLIAGLLWAMRPSPPIQLNLGDGRILQIEAVTYGIQHRIGTDSPLKRFRPWLPASVVRYFSMDRRANDITLDRPGLVVWVNALSEVGKTNVDCQGIRVEFVDRNGDLFGETARSWFGGPDFWRVGHVFYCYPREEQELQMRVTPWKKPSNNQERDTVTTTLMNPKRVKAAIWRGEALPQTKLDGNFEIRLKSVNVRTNGQGGKKARFETAARYFEPDAEVLAAGKPATGWEPPTWIAEAANGNQGQYLGVHHEALQFAVAIYPAATNLEAAEVILTLPPVDLTTLTTNLWWNITNASSSKTVTVLGLFQTGTHTFSEGVYHSSSVAVSGPRGGAKSGWTGRSQQVTPLKQIVFRHHYTPTPVIYLRVPPQALDPFTGVGEGDETGADRFAVRIHDEHGNQWIAKPDGEVNGVHPFRLELPADVTRFNAEVILLRPLKARFLVNTKSLSTL